MKNQLSHIDASGAATMVDVTAKPATHREARASATVTMNAQAMQQLIVGNNKKGDVLGVARIAGIQAAKKCGDLIPLCHPLALTGVQVDLAIDEATNSVNVNTACKVQGGTGVEMEALCAATVAALTIYDMCKAVDKGIVISEVILLEKTGGKSGHWIRAEDE